MPIYPILEEVEPTEPIKAQMENTTQIPIPAQRKKPIIPDPIPQTIDLQRPEAVVTFAPPVDGNDEANSGEPAVPAYPSLRELMGMEFSEETIRLNMPEYLMEPSSPPGLKTGSDQEGGKTCTAQPDNDTEVTNAIVALGVPHCNVTKKKSKDGKVGLKVRGLQIGQAIQLKTNRLIISLKRI